MKSPFKILSVALIMLPAISSAATRYVEVPVDRTIRGTPLSNNEVRDIMIKETLITRGDCTCPYSPDSLGGECGTESLYYKPRNYKLFCYRYDITSEDVHFYRLKKAFIFYPELAEVEVEEVVVDGKTVVKEASKDKNKAQVISAQPIGNENPTSSYFRNNAASYSNPQNNPTTNTTSNVNPYTSGNATPSSGFTVAPAIPVYTR